MNEVKKQKQLDVINSKLPAGLTVPNGAAPVRGAVFEMGGWIMPKIKRPNLDKLNQPESQRQVPVNSFSEDDLSIDMPN